MFAEPEAMVKPKPMEMDDPEALQELTELLATPARHSDGGIAELLADALSGGGGSAEHQRQKLLAAIEAQQRVATTPPKPRRASSYVAMTPPAVDPRKHGKPENGGEKPAGEEGEMPYIASPSRTEMMPSPGAAARSRSRTVSRTPIKLHHRKPTPSVQPGQGLKSKLEAVRSKETENLAEIVEASDDELPTEPPGGGDHGGPGIKDAESMD